MTITGQTKVGFGLILSLAGTMAGASTPALPQKASPAWFVAQAAKPWLPRYDPKTDWNFTHASKAAQQACLRSEALPIPRGDLPTTAQAPRLMSCNSEALYYGLTGEPDYVRARMCAYLERAAGNRFPIASSAILSMIYANGRGVKRNLPLAMKFACESGGAPAEINGRIRHLEDLATATGEPQQPFGFCDDITSGYMEGICTGVAATYRDARREKSIAHIASSYSPTQRAAFSALRDAAADYFNAHAKNEVDLSGTARGAFWIEDIQHNWDLFLRDLMTLEADTLPAAGAKASRQADTRLNATLHAVLAEPSLRQRPPAGFPPPGIPVVGGTISRQGIRVDQYLWLSYRDAWLHFAAVRKPTLPRSTVQAWITNQRIDNLGCLLPSRAPGARDCTRPALLPSNMQP
jgi:hypothetical protein